MDLIVYHGDCPDGWCAAYIALKKWPEARLFPAFHGGPVPETKGLDVIMLDFSWKGEILRKAVAESRNFSIYDHHITAKEHIDAVADQLYELDFDIARSGAMITWNRLHPDVEPPLYVQYVQDRDLWRWVLPHSREVNSYLMALPQTPEAWDALDSIDDLEMLVARGTAIRLHIEHYVEKLVAQRQMGDLGGRKCAVVNAAYLNISDVLHRLVQDSDVEVGLGWFERGDGLMQFSVASEGDIDVSVIARGFGGGGHKNAAGFQVDIPSGRKIVDSILHRGVRI